MVDGVVDAAPGGGGQPQVVPQVQEGPRDVPFEMDPDELLIGHVVVAEERGTAGIREAETVNPAIKEPRRFREADVVSESPLDPS